MVDQPITAAAAAASRSAAREDRPEATRTIEGIGDAFRSHGYIAERSLATTVFLALELGRPLLLEGEAGVGKTELAKVLAASLGTRLIRLQCYEGLDVNTAVYEWNYPRQMLEIRLLEAARRDRQGDGARHLQRRVPAQAPAPPGARGRRRHRPVLLIDEIDRADEEFEAYLLEILSDFQVTVPEIGTIRAAAAAARDPHLQPDARGPRRAQAPLPVPLDRLPHGGQGVRDRRHPRAGRRPQQLAREVVAFVHRLRTADLTKVPGVAETLDWAAALLSLGATELAPGRGGRDARRGPQVRGGHPPGPRRHGAPVPRRGRRGGLSASSRRAEVTPSAWVGVPS